MEVIKQQCRDTNLKKLGVEYPSQHPEVLSKILTSGFKFKNYIFPSGKTVKIQGYENKALDNLLLENIDESNIMVGIENIPVFEYTYNDKIKKYHPDIYINHLNLIIEVKSTWTWDLEKNKIYRN